MNARLKLLAPYFDTARLQSAARALSGFMSAGATPMAIPTLRLTAARNLGITAPFLASTGRDFMGTVADYRDLTAAQQVALTDEMLRLIRATPDQFTQQQVAVAAAQTHPLAQLTPIEQESTLSLLGQGAAQGAGNAAGFVQNLLIGASDTTGKVLSNLLGGSLGSILTKLGLAALVIGAISLGAQSYLKKKAQPKPL